MGINERQKLADWAERLGILIVASLIVPKILTGATLSDSALAVGLLLAFAAYFAAGHFLKG